MVNPNSRATGLQPKASGEEHRKRLAELHALALGHLRSGKLLKAQSSAKEALKLDADDPETLHLMAVVSVAASQLEHAVEWASRAIRRDPQPTYLATLGMALLKASRLDEALRVLDKAVHLKPDDAELWRQMGDALIQARRNGEALLCLRRAFELDPRNADAAYKVGHILHGMGQFAESCAYLNQSAELQPDHVPTLQTRALVLNGLGRIEEATADCRRAAELDPKNADILANLGAFLRAQGHLEQALSSFDRSLKIKPNAGKAIVGRASVLADLGRVEEAMSAYKRSAAIGSEHARSVWNLALLQMLTGDFSRGLKGMQVRWDVAGLPNGYPPLAGPKWLGDGNIAGKTIRASARESVQTWESRLGPPGRSRVGLVWSGNPEHLNDRNRSVPLRTLTRLLDTKASFVSLQKDVRPGDRAELLARTDIFDAAQHLADFGETAALISCLDLVITVDTSVAHLSAALGKPTWVLLPFMPDYRWLLGREDSPWYPTVRLFRQTQTREYASVVEDVREALLGWLDRAA